jgi:hypothetical protein
MRTMRHESEESSFRENVFPEIVKGVQYHNFSGRSLEEVIHFFQNEENKNAFSKVVILPDFSPVRGPLPTGSCVEVKPEFNWKELVLSDIGCGIALVKSEVSWDYFNNNLNLWDQTTDRLRKNKGKKGDLGSGNHFLDAVVDENDNVYFAVHTGSRNQALRIDKLLNSYKFENEYQQVSQWAKGNRMEVLKVLKSIYGPLENVLDKSHNFYVKEKNTGRVLVYKGAMKLLPNQLGIIPSSMDGEMLVVRGKSILKDIDYAMCHGTGRLTSRSIGRDEAEGYDIKSLRKRIYIPQSIGDSSVIPERPEGYRKIEDVKLFVSRFANIEKVLIPIAYIGQI